MRCGTALSAVRAALPSSLPPPPPPHPYYLAGPQTEAPPVRPGATQAVHSHEKISCPAEPRHASSCRYRLVECFAELLCRVGPVSFVENRGVRLASGLGNGGPEAGDDVGARDGGFPGISDGGVFVGCYSVGAASAADPAH